MADSAATFPPGFFDRLDETPDASFYALPRFVTHIDDATIAALTAYYAETLRPAADVLDLMSSLNRDLGATFVIATHNSRLVSRATLVIELANGRLTSPAPPS